MDMVDRRSFLKAVGSAGLLSALPETAFAADGRGVVHEVAEPGQDAAARPKYSVRFAVAGMSHDHIYGMVGAMLRGGGELVSVYAAEPERGAEFVKRFPQAKQAASVEEILNDPSIQLVLSSAVPSERAPIGIRAMQHGKDFLSDKPGVTTLEQLAEVRRVQAETKRIYGIMYSERLEVRAAVKAGELVQAGAIGRVIQTINIAPHLIQYPNQPPRPEWFWDPARNGGILTDIGSHQVDQFLFYTGSKKVEVVASQVGNVNHPQHPKFQDFGNVMLQGDRGVGYVRVDWFTPDGLGVWGDGRLFLLGTEGYIELRKYVDIVGRKGGNHLFVVDGKQTRYIDCGQVELPFGPQFISDIVNRTETGQSQTQTLLAAELVLKAQERASLLHFSA
ncbi:MAG TPA: Gfo/Idh/MocA family oxidoreductase [Granulicella sp.]|nr:Gfo/Idh/MocA family oxidoreductase [Granulicella sp.]